MCMTHAVGRADARHGGGAAHPRGAAGRVQRDDGVLRLHATLGSVSVAGRLATCSAQAGLQVRRTRWLVLHRGCSREVPPAGECAAPAASMGAAPCGALAPSASIARPPGRVLDYARVRELNSWRAAQVAVTTARPAGEPSCGCRTLAQRKAGLLPAIACSPTRTQAPCELAAYSVFRLLTRIKAHGQACRLSSPVSSGDRGPLLLRSANPGHQQGPTSYFTRAREQGSARPCSAYISSIRMAATTDNEDLKAQLDAAQAAATKQGDTVRSLKALAKDGKADKAWH